MGIPERFREDWDPEPRERPSPDEYEGLDKLTIKPDPEMDRMIRETFEEMFPSRVPPRKPHS